jgi:hypothetical protein
MSTLLNIHSFIEDSIDRETIAIALYTEIARGDDEHKAWLKQKVYEFFQVEQ